jgi:hypothetical protein
MIDQISNPEGAACVSASFAAGGGVRRKGILAAPFPDAGRAVNLSEPHWPATLRGESAEICRLLEVRSQAEWFPVCVRVLIFPTDCQAISGCSSVGNNRSDH